MGVAKVLYFGLVQNLVGLQEEEVDLPEGVSLGQLLDLLIEKHGEPLGASILTKERKLRPLARVAVDGRPLGEIGGLDAKLEGTKEVTIVVMVHPMEGGQVG